MNEVSLSKGPLHYDKKEGRGKGEERNKRQNSPSDCQEFVMPAALTELSRTCICFTLQKNQTIQPLKAKRQHTLKIHLLSILPPLIKMTFQSRAGRSGLSLLQVQVKFS